MDEIEKWSLEGQVYWKGSKKGERIYLIWQQITFKKNTRMTLTFPSALSWAYWSIVKFHNVDTDGLYVGFLGLMLEPDFSFLFAHSFQFPNLFFFQCNGFDIFLAGILSFFYYPLVVDILVSLILLSLLFSQILVRN